jgi:vitamin-K-epoxide reductase (warfarin-sensitive)
MRYWIALLALAGVVVAGLALRVHYSTDTEPCSINEKWDCGIVNHSPYAVLSGMPLVGQVPALKDVPVAAVGIGGYAVLLVLALAGRRKLVLGAAIPGLAFALYLTYIEKYILLVWCVYCVSSLGIISLITLSGLGWVFMGKKAAG